MPLRDTSSKVHRGVDDNNFIGDFCNDLESVTKLKEFMETNSPDEPTEMHGAVRDITPGVLVARASRRLRGTKRPNLTAAQSSTLLGPPLPMRRHRRTSTSRTPCALTWRRRVAWCPRNIFLDWLRERFCDASCELRRHSAADSDVRGPQIQTPRLGQRARHHRGPHRGDLWRSSLTPHARSHGAACEWRCWLTRRTTSKRSCQGSLRI